MNCEQEIRIVEIVHHNMIGRQLVIMGSPAIVNSEMVGIGEIK